MYNSKKFDVLWIRNCSAYSEPVTSHALGGLAYWSRSRLGNKTFPLGLGLKGLVPVPHYNYVSRPIVGAYYTSKTCF